MNKVLEAFNKEHFLDIVEQEEKLALKGDSINIPLYECDVTVISVCK